jgi:hypothetical protein
VHAREQGSRKIAGKLRRQKSDGSGSESDAREKKVGSTPIRAAPFIGFLSPYNTPQRLYSEKFARRLWWIFR